MHNNALITTAAVAAAALTILGSAQAADLIAYEGFDYGATPNLALANGGTGWSGSWHNIGALPTGVILEDLYYPNLQGSGGSAFTAPYPSTDFARYSRAVAPYTPTNGVVYLSFLFRPNTGYGLGGGLAFGSWDNGMVVGVHPGSGLYGLTTPPGDQWSDSSVPMAQGEITFVVARIEQNEDSTFTWSMFVNPALGGAEPAVADAELVSTLGFPQAAFIYNDGGFSTDEIRIGHTWASVAPAIAPPCEADIDGNGIVDGADLGQLLGNWGMATGDLTGDGVVDGADLGTLLGAWGDCAQL